MNNSIYNPLHGPQLIVYDVNELCIKKVQSIVRPSTIRLYMKQLVLNLLVNIPNLKRLLKKTDDVLNRLFFYHHFDIKFEKSKLLINYLYKVWLL